jgi:hypothetical protein
LVTERELVPKGAAEEFGPRREGSELLEASQDGKEGEGEGEGVL